MIKQLTKEQQDRFGEFRDKWLKIGLCSDPANRKEAERGIYLAYDAAEKKHPKIVWCSSPLAQGMVRSVIMRDSVGDSVGASVGASVGDSVRASVENSVYGSHEAHWLGFYDYFYEVCQLKKETEGLLGLWIISKNAGWFLPHENFCWISERHNICRLNPAGVIHCASGPAIQYPDSWSIYGLNGVRMEEWMVMTPAEKIDPKEILKVENVEQRRELLRKVGIERFVQKVGARSIEDSETYSLLRVDFPGLDNCRYLKMRNPSIGVWHLEGVPRDIETIQQAINWRKYGDKDKQWTPSVLT